MKKSILLALLMSTVLAASAQWVTIPDANFVNALTEQFPECLNENQLDTTCTAILETTYLDLEYEEISDLSGIHYFDNLEVLICGNNILTLIPELPGGLTQLDCGNNQLTSLPDLPPSLTSLSCDWNNLTALPELSQSLTFLNCHMNQISSLPPLPPYIEFLGCSSNQLTSLPPFTWTFSLTNLVCSENFLTSIPALPPSLTELSCGMNQLTSLPELPATLDALVCGDNPISSLPALPQSLTVLICSNSQLTILPELPSSLIYLACNNNDIYCLPILPMSLTNPNGFFINQNPFTCLPNYVPAMGDVSTPLCDLNDLENNPYGCSSIEGIQGRVFQDDNVNCLWNANEDGLVNFPLQLLDDEGNQLATGQTSSLLTYTFSLDTGDYVVKIPHEGLPFQPSCDIPGDEQEVLLSSEIPSAVNIDFGVTCLPDFDIGTQSVATTGWIFPGQEHKLSIDAGDLSNWYGLQCSEGISGSVTINVTGPVSYAGPTENSLVPDVSGDIQFTYEISNFGDIDFEESFGVFLETDTTAQAGDLICVEVIVEPIQDDANPENNIYTHCYEVLNSYDPNIKQVWPQDVEPEYDGYFNYTIYFQNTGTAPAFNIRVADTLDANLDLSTFQVTGYSHECLTYVSGNVATFRFNNIMLPDSTSDFEGSIGYVQYRIKAVEDLPVGTIIENTAHIFFDFNDAIVTNTTQNEFVITTSTNEIQKQLATVFPNPGTGQFNVLFKNSYSGTTHLEVYNLNGQRVVQQQVNENRVVLDLTDYPSGMYLLHVRNERGTEAVKLVKQ